MLDITFGGRGQNRARVSRRGFLRVGTMTLGGLTLADALKQRAAAATAGRPSNKKSVIFFWQDGGPSHIETYDPKPEAPSEFRGPFGAIATAVPGVFINELFPKHAAIMDKLSIIRSVCHDNGDHYTAQSWVWTGYFGSTNTNPAPMYPSVGSIISKVRGPNQPGLPPYVAIPPGRYLNMRPGYQTGAYLGVATNPFCVDADPNSDHFQVQNLEFPVGINPGRVVDRQRLLTGLDRMRRTVDTSGQIDGIDRFNQIAFDLISSGRARKAFDVSQEDARLRDRYGRNSVGQGALLARRLIEAGVTFVSIHTAEWDNHSNIEPGMKNHAASLDPAVATLVEDLAQRGLYDDVIVLVMGEFGRTPRVNVNAGRDHWSNAFSVLLAGGGIQPGRIVGKTDDKAAWPIERPVKPADVLHTVYQLLGVDTTIHFLNRAGRPIPILNEGEPIAELL
ncbi:MAG TPA: DUF1501 domain-containing protein [Pirellulales bacterium]|nr:DUF1501 domain-containing protein [Pirellulales bacterium]